MDAMVAQDGAKGEEVDGEKEWTQAWPLRDTQ